MARPAKIVIVDDHSVVRVGIRLMLQADPTFECCGEAANAEEALEVIRKTHPDLAIVDIALPGISGVELIKRIGAESPHTRTLVLTMYDETVYAERVLRAGAQGYVMKHQATEKILEAIRTILDGHFYLSAPIQRLVLDHFLRPQAKRQAFGLAALTDREFEILRLIGSGCSTAEISQHLRRSAKTIETHRLHLKEKIGLKSSAELSYFATRWLTGQAGEPTSD